MAHGFLVLSDEAIFSYKVDNVYSPQNEATLLWNNYSFKIDWGMNEKELLLSDKDKEGLDLSKL